MKDKYVIATRDRIARNDLSQLSFWWGDIIRVFQKNSDTLWRGENQGRRGFFPSNLCDPAEDQDAFRISGSTTPTALSSSQPYSQSSTQEKEGIGHSSSSQDSWQIDLSTNSTPPPEPTPVVQRSPPNPPSTQSSSLTLSYNDFLTVTHVRALGNYAKPDSGPIQ